MTVARRLGGQLLRRTPTWALIGGLAVMGLWRALRWLAVHAGVTGALLLAVLTWWAVDRGWWPWLMLATGCICLGLGTAMELNPRWWRRLSGTWASRRRLAWYRRRWEPAMIGAGLTLGDDLPQLLRHRFGGMLGERDTDMLSVRTVPGQTLADWRNVADRLAAAWGRTRVRVHATSGVAPRELTLVCSSRPLPDRTAVAGGQVPSTAVDEPVDEPGGAFPRRPR